MVGRSSVFFLGELNLKKILQQVLIFILTNFKSLHSCCIFPLLNFAHRLWYLEIRLWLPLLHP